MTMLGHAAAEHRAVANIEGGEHGGDAVAFVIVGHGPAFARLERQPRLDAVERLDLPFFVYGQHHGLHRGIDVEPDDVLDLLSEAGSLERLKVRSRFGCR